MCHAKNSEHGGLCKKTMGKIPSAEKDLCWQNLQDRTYMYFSLKILKEQQVLLLLCTSDWQI